MRLFNRTPLAGRLLSTFVPPDLPRTSISLLTVAILTFFGSACASTGPADAGAADPASSAELEAPAPAPEDTAPGEQAGEQAGGESGRPEVRGDVSGPLAILAEQIAASGSPDAGAPADASGLEPEDGQWLVDEEGNEYFLKTLSKEGPFLRLDDNLVRTRWGVSVVVDREDEDYFYYRVYRTQVNPPPESTTLPEEEVEAMYVNDVVVRDGVALVSSSEGLPERGQWRNGFSVADINGDGHLDIIHGPSRKSMGGPQIFLGDGQGGWRVWADVRFELSRRLDYGDAVVADFNGDGRPDVAFGSHLMGVLVTVQAEPGRFVEWSEGTDYSVPGQGADASSFSSRALEVVDWNGDGRPDVAALGEGPRLYLLGRGEGPRPGSVEAYGTTVYLNGGDGTWSPLRLPVRTGKPFGDSLEVGDFDGDGRPDLATGLNVRFQREIVYLNRTGEGAEPELLSLDELRGGSYPRAVAAADFDGDGRDDLLVAYMSFESTRWRSGFDLLLAREGGEWVREPLYVEDGNKGFYAIGTGDVDGDGSLDVVAVSGDGRAILVVGDGHGGFARLEGAIPPYPGRCRGYAVRLADIDGDGRDEVIGSFAGEPSAMFDPDRCTSGGGIRVWDLPPGEGPRGDG